MDRPPSRNVPSPSAAHARHALRHAGVRIPAPLAALRGHWPLPVAPMPAATWPRALRDWVCWATAPDFITLPPAAPVSAREPVLPDWARPLAAARRLRELAVEGAVGAWTPGRLARFQMQLSPTVPATLRQRSAWFGDRADALELAPTPEMLPGLVEDLCAFIDHRAPDPLAQAALAHDQLLAIRPFDDGNARLARVVASAIVARGGLAPETCFPVFALRGRGALGAHDATHHDEITLAARGDAWRRGFRRGTAFANVLQHALDEWVVRLAARLGGEQRAQRLAEMASARPVLDAWLVRSAAGAQPEAQALHWQALRDEGWSPVGGDPEAPAWLAGTRFWQRAAALWAMAANAERASSASNDTPAPARQEPIEA
ncbi:MAG: Fic family protein [Xanthomonadaceae bacterium]|nr:Fic family protein [Xanthomonadaceae bacterium]